MDKMSIIVNKRKLNDAKENKCSFSVLVGPGSVTGLPSKD